MKTNIRFFPDSPICPGLQFSMNTPMNTKPIPSGKLTVRNGKSPEIWPMGKSTS